MTSIEHQICDVVECLPRAATLTGNLQECVLLIEDSEEAMLLVRYAMQEYGNGTYRLEWADGLTSGLQRLAKGGIDIVLLDLGLPESSGAASYDSIRSAAPDVPVLVLTGDTREQTEIAVSAHGVEDYLVKDEISGSLLLEAIRTTLYSNKRWQDRKASAYKLTRRFHWADEKCQALLALGTRLVKLNKIEPALACGKAISAIVDNYGETEGAHVQGRADLFLTLERLARVANAKGNKELARQYRAIVAPPSKCGQAIRQEFEAAVRRRIEQLDNDPTQRDLDFPAQDSADLAQLLRQILEGVPTAA